MRYRCHHLKWKEVKRIFDEARPSIIDTSSENLANKAKPQVIEQSEVTPVTHKINFKRLFSDVEPKKGEFSNREKEEE